mgnify:CR=1 FL=1
MFEGYVGIRLWDGQLVDDVIFSLLLSLLIAFAIIFRSNFQHFVKMLKDVVYLKERQNLFDETIGKSGSFFRNFMTFQALFLCSIALFAIARARGMVNHLGEKEVLFAILIIFAIFSELVILLYAIYSECQEVFAIFSERAQKYERTY